MNEADEALMKTADQLGRLIEISAGHKSIAVEAGFSDKSAEEMAVCLHSALVQTVMAKAK